MAKMALTTSAIVSFVWHKRVMHTRQEDKTPIRSTVINKEKQAENNQTEYYGLILHVDRHGN